MGNMLKADPDYMDLTSFREILQSGGEFLKTNVPVEGHPFAKPIPAVVFGKKIKTVKAPVRSHKAFFIPGNVLSSKNHKRIMRRRLALPWKLQDDPEANLKKHGRRYPIRQYRCYIDDTEAVKNYKKKTARYYREYAEDFRQSVNAMSPAYVEFLFVRNTHSLRWDFANMLQIVQDQMSAYGWIVDENIMNFCPVPPMNGPVVSFDKYHPGVRITVLQIDNDANKR